MHRALHREAPPVPCPPAGALCVGQDRDNSTRTRAPEFGLCSALYSIDYTELVHVLPMQGIPHSSVRGQAAERCAIDHDFFSSIQVLPLLRIFVLHQNYSARCHLFYVGNTMIERCVISVVAEFLLPCYVVHGLGMLLSNSSMQHEAHRYSSTTLSFTAGVHLPLRGCAWWPSCRPPRRPHAGNRGVPI